MKQPTQVFPSTYRVSSDVFNAQRLRADYAIGRPDGPIGNCFFIAKEEVIELLQNLPDDLLPYVKGYEAPQEPEVVEEQPVEEVEEDEQIPDKPFEDMNVKELKEVAKRMEISGYSDMRRDDLLEAIHADIDKRLDEA